MSQIFSSKKQTHFTQARCLYWEGPTIWLSASVFSFSSSSSFFFFFLTRRRTTTATGRNFGPCRYPCSRHNEWQAAAAVARTRAHTRMHSKDSKRELLRPVGYTRAHTHTHTHAETHITQTHTHSEGAGWGECSNKVVRAAEPLEETADGRQRLKLGLLSLETGWGTHRARHLF